MLRAADGGRRSGFLRRLGSVRSTRIPGSVERERSEEEEEEEEAEERVCGERIWSQRSGDRSDIEPPPPLFAPSTPFSFHASWAPGVVLSEVLSEGFKRFSVPGVEVPGSSPDRVKHVVVSPDVK